MGELNPFIGDGVVQFNVGVVSDVSFIVPEELMLAMRASDTAAIERVTTTLRQMLECVLAPSSHWQGGVKFTASRSD